MTTLRQRLALLAAVIGLGAASLPAGASSIALQPSTGTVAQNGQFTVQLLINALDAPGSHPGLYGGQIVVDFNPAQLAYNGFSLASGVSFFSSPVTGSSGGRQTVTLGFDNAPDQGVVGTFTFTALAAPGTTAGINLEDADAFFGTFAAYVPTYQPIYPTFVDTSVQVVPLPGAAWLFLAGAGAALARARRRVTAAG